MPAFICVLSNDAVIFVRICIFSGPYAISRDFSRKVFPTVIVSQCGQATWGLMVRSGLYEMVPICWYKKQRFRHSVHKNKVKSKMRHSMCTVPQEKHSIQSLLSVYHIQVFGLIFLGWCHYTSLRNATPKSPHKTGIPAFKSNRMRAQGYVIQSCM